MELKLLSECSDYDYKEFVETKKPKSWLKSVSAFANGFGGSIFFGVNDNGNIVGLENISDATTKISELIKSRIEPTPIFRLIPHEEDKRLFLQLEIMKGQSTPYYYHSDGSRIAFIRSGDESIEAPNYILNEMILRGIGQTYDSIITDKLFENFSFDYLKTKYFERLNLRIINEDFVSFNLSEGGYLTRAGLLFADDNRVLQSRIFCTRWNGIDKLNEDTVINDIEINGSLLRQLDMAMDFFKANTAVKWHKEKGETVYEPDYNEEAIKEALVNAIVHRDYNVLGAEVVLNIYDDRIEITSPGGMYSGKKIPTIVDSVVESKRRNPIIADLFHRMKLMNRRGSGLANISNRTNMLFGDEKNHVFYNSDDGFFRVRIENANYSVKSSVKMNETTNDTLNKNEEAILDIIRSNRFVTLNEMADVLKISRSTVIRTTNGLVNKNRIKRIGANKNGYWEIL